MKNVGKKILILVLVLGLTVAGILTFYPSIVAPPSEVPMENLHLLTLEKNIVRADIPRYSDSIYRMVEDKLELYLDESYITGQEKDEQTKALIEKYVPTFIDLCNSKFEASQWFDADHVAMENRIADLKGLTIAGESTVLGYDNLVELERIEQVIEDYRSAWEVAKYSKFKSVNDAKAKISEADKYIDHDPIKNCRELVATLKTVKTRIGNSHYRQVDNEVDNLACYKSINESEWYDHYTKVIDRITAYREIYYLYGHDNNKLNDLNQKAQRYSEEADIYYNENKKIVLELGGWKEIESTDDYYKMYKSFANYHKDDQNAIMILKVRNLDKIEFYLMNDSEYKFDYILVKKGACPTVDSRGVAICDYSSKDRPKSEGWMKVSYSSLDPNKETEIYIMYRKDYNGAEGKDCGKIAIHKDYFK